MSMDRESGYYEVTPYFQRSSVYTGDNPTQKLPVGSL